MAKKNKIEQQDDLQKLAEEMISISSEVGA